MGYLIGYYLLGEWWFSKDREGFDLGQNEIIIPGPGEEKIDLSEETQNGLTWRKWDDAVLGVAILAVVMFSKPWK